MRTWILALLSLFFVVGCGGGSSGSGSADRSNPNQAQAGLTTFRVAVPSVSPSSVRSQTTRIERIVLNVFQNETTVRTAQATVTVGQNFVNLSVEALPPGDYIVQVQGFQGDQLLATDTARATLLANTPTTVTLTLTFIQPLVVTPSNFNLTPGATQQLTVTRDGANVAATFVSNDPGIATVDTNGLVTGVVDGTTQIQVTSDGETVTATVTVSATVVLNTITVTPAAANLLVGSTVQFTAIGNFSDGSTQNLTNTATWSSSVPGFATINAATGLATAVADGTTTISATPH